MHNVHRETENNYGIIYSILNLKIIITSTYNLLTILQIKNVILLKISWLYMCELLKNINKFLNQKNIDICTY